MQELLGIEEAARRLGCHSQTLRRRIASGALPAEKRFGRWKINFADLERVLEKETDSGVTPDEEARLEQTRFEQYEGKAGEPVVDADQAAAERLRRYYATLRSEAPK